MENTTPYVAQENGLVERMMQSLTRSLQIGKYYGISWKTLFATLTFAYNQRPHSITGEASANAMFKRKVKSSFPEICFDDVLSDEQIRDNDRLQKKKGKDLIDGQRRAKHSSLSVGDSVLVQNKI